MRLPFLIALASLGACAEFPQLESTIDAAARNAPYPVLQPLGPLLAQADAQQSKAPLTAASVAAFETRLASLQARANRLRGPVIDAQTRARLRRGVAVSSAIR
tara:strand:- start:4268 stop:4576 length:309 start_codon:yes stop_codon:yes gene_type:complete